MPQTPERPEGSSSMLLTLALLAALSAQPNPLAAANKALADQDWARI